MYIPKNRILTNQYTSGGEYIVKSNGENYVGFYHKLYTGEIFTGKTPNDSNIRQLILNESNSPQNEPPESNTVNTIALFLNDPDPIVDTSIWNQRNIVDYLKATGQDTKDDQPKETPYTSKPKPTQEDYNLGVFTRYFCVKINEDIYLEIDKKTYDALTNQKEDWLWQLYTPFQLLWTISGEEKEIEKTNYNITLLQEKRLKRRGLQQFLRNNYLKFYPSPYNVSDVTSSITPTTTPVKENKPSIKDLFKLTQPKPNLIISPEEIANAQTATPLVTSSVGNPLTGIRVDTSFEDPKADQRRT